METAVVILNYNGVSFLKQFLPTVVKLSPDAAIIVADNGSTDESIQYLQRQHPEIRCINLQKNYGFAEGYNRALAQLDFTYYVLLNSDVEVTPNWLDAPLKLLIQRPNLAAVQPKIKDFYNKANFEYAGAAGGQMDFLGFAFCAGRIFDSIEKDSLQYEKVTEIFWATGACLFIKKQIFEAMGGFDERYFAHFEEIDLCWRIKNQGYEILYCPDSEIYHVGGGTLHKSNPYKTFLNYRNNLATLYKNLPPNKLFTTLLTRLILDGISALRFLKEGNLKDIWAIIKAHFAFYGMIPYLKTKRSTQFLAYSTLYPQSIIWQYFIKKKKTYPELSND